MTPTIRTSGNTRPHIIAPGYRHTTRLSGSILPMRPEGEPSLLAGVAIVLAGLAVIVAAASFIQGAVS